MEIKGKILLSFVLAFAIFPPSGSSAQDAERVDWVGVNWAYEKFDNGHGLAGYTLFTDALALAPGAGCKAQGEALFSRIEGLEGAVYEPPPLVLRNNETRSYRLKSRVDMEATLLYGADGVDCGAQITVLNPIDWPR